MREFLLTERVNWVRFNTCNYVHVNSQVLHYKVISFVALPLSPPCSGSNQEFLWHFYEHTWSTNTRLVAC